MDAVARVREHFAESIATKETAAEQIAESIATAGRVMSDALLDDGKIMLDIGVSFKLIKEHVSKVKAILISHVHSDHYKFSTIKKAP